jgi:hypothetical protein
VLKPITADVAKAAGAVVESPAICAVVSPANSMVDNAVTCPLSLIDRTGICVLLPTLLCAVVMAASEIVPLSVIVPPASPSPAVMLVTVPVPVPPPSPDWIARMLIAALSAGAVANTMEPPLAVVMV